MGPLEQPTSVARALETMFEDAVIVRTAPAPAGLFEDQALLVLGRAGSEARGRHDIERKVAIAVLANGNDEETNMIDSNVTSGSPRLIGPDGGDLMGAAGRQDRFLIESHETEGRFSLVEHILEPRALAAPMHFHTREDEYTFVLEGRVGAILGDHEVYAEAGDLLFKPRGEWHTFWNGGDTPARMLEIISAGGLERLFRQLDSLADWPDPATLMDMAGEYGCRLDFEATVPLMERLGLEL